MLLENKPPTVLVVEDEPLVRELLVTELTDVGYRVVSADTGEKALSLLRDRKDQIDWLFTDIRLPGPVDGWAVADEFRMTHPLRPVVYATAYEQDEARQLEGSFFFRKPYRPAQVVAAFRRLSGDLQMRRQLGASAA